MGVGKLPLSELSKKCDDMCIHSVVMVGRTDRRTEMAIKQYRAVHVDAR